MAIFTVPARGVGRPDYSSSVEISVEPVITSHESVYSYRGAVVIAAASSTVTNVTVPLNQVVLLHDFYASIPANMLIRLVVEAIDRAGTITEVVDQSGYQGVTAHISKGYPFFQTIRFTTYNYQPLAAENNMRIGCAGFYTSAEEYYIVPNPYL